MENKEKTQDSDYLFQRVVLLMEKLAAQMGVVYTFGETMLAAQDTLLENQKREGKLDDMKKTENNIKDLEGLRKFLRQAQIDLFDIIKALKGPKEGLDNEKAFDVKALDEADQISEQMNKSLPKRETPVLPAGNILSVNLFLASSFAKEAQLTFGLYLGENESLLQHEMVSKMAVYIEKLESTLFLLGRWSNLILNQKEFIWTPPKENPENTPSQNPNGSSMQQQPTQQTTPPNTN